MIQRLSQRMLTTGYKADDQLDHVTLGASLQSRSLMCRIIGIILHP